MNLQVKNAVESALIAALAFGVCLWLLVSANEDGASAVRCVFAGIGIAVALVAHWAYMGVALYRSGRSVWAWMPGLVCLFPVLSVVALVLLNAHDEDKGRAESTGS